MNMQPTLRIPHGIADVQAELAYVAGPNERIVALDLTRGEIVARSDFAATPVAADDGLLIGWRSVISQPNAVQLIAAIRRGEEIRATWEATLELPNWVDLESSEPEAFTLDVEIQEGVVVINWDAHARYRGGAPPPPDVEKAATHNERGTVRLDRDTGAPVDPEERTELEQSAAEAPADTVFDRQIVPYRSGPLWVTASWRVGTADSFLIRPKHGPGVVLLRREAGIAGEIGLSDDADAEVAVTPDGRLIFIHEPGGGARSWKVFSAATTKRVASLPFDPGTEWVAALDDRVLYHVVEDAGTTRRQSLRCRSLQTGELMWSQTLGEVALGAPPPPMR